MVNGFLIFGSWLICFAAGFFCGSDWEIGLTFTEKDLIDSGDEQ